MQRSNRNDSTTKQTKKEAQFNDDDVVVNGQDSGFAIVNVLVPKQKVVDHGFEVVGATSTQYPQTAAEFATGIAENVATDLNSLATEVRSAAYRFYSFAASTGGSLMSLAEQAKTDTSNALAGEAELDAGPQPARPKSP